MVTPTAEADPVYVFFGLWPEARLWMRDRWIAPADLIMASQPQGKIEQFAHDRRVVMVRGYGYPLGEGGPSEWKARADWIREHNGSHDWVSEIIDTRND